VQVIADARPLDLRAEGIDLAIRFGLGRYPGYSTSLLMRDRVLPVCSPQLMTERGRVRSVDELLKLPLLHDSAADGDGSLSDWRSWLDQLGRPDAAASLAGQRFSHAGLAIEAAMLGLGVALARLSLAADLLTNGTLVCPLPATAPTAFAYYLVAPSELSVSPKIARLCQWLRAEASDMEHVAKQVGLGEAAGRIDLMPSAQRASPRLRLRVAV